MRQINNIVVHCTAGNQKQTLGALRAEFKRKGWKNPGYHYVVLYDGHIEQMLDDELVANGVKGHNADSIHVAYTGGYDGTDMRTDAQKAQMRALLRVLKKKYPKAVILGHRDLSADLNGDGRITPNEWVKLCPCFNARDEYFDIK